MLKDYFARLTTDQERRVMAVEAALEIAKASVSAPSSYTGIKTDFDLKKVASEINALADAIQDALETDDDEE
ncbi:hypothetical protein J1J25_001230 [Salmonella enterica subsp. diarizonae serovar 53:r:z35]|nr:hypothetical protein [Salmonella enterica subsp. diarizonae serovar 53:r:z35]